LLTCVRRIYIHVPPRALQPEDDAGQTRPKAVVKVAAQPASLFLHRGHQALS